jgi:mono/diheme cytochrome c family protein
MRHQRTSTGLRGAGALATLALTLAAAACTDGNTRKIQYMPDMADSPANKAQRPYLDPPEGSVAMNAIIYPKTIEESEKVLQMPPRIKEDPSTLTEGKVLFETFCAVCHGPDAHGHNALGPKFPTPPDITGEIYRNHGDGFFFYRITFGSAIMPSYGHAISANERWEIISYLRTLQKAGQ